MVTRQCTGHVGDAVRGCNHFWDGQLCHKEKPAEGLEQGILTMVPKVYLEAPLRGPGNCLGGQQGAEKQKPGTLGPRSPQPGVDAPLLCLPQTFGF